ncbi:MAG: inositol monophosphatase [Pedobacter sp.]|nr:MAG: inositol monophosphatase [Pedobacter sp.]
MDYELLCAKVIATTRLTGNFIRKESINFSSSSIELKGLNDLVSYVDKIHGIPTYAISIALYEHGKPIIGVVYEINRSEMFSAYKGGGAFLNGKPIHVSKRAALSECLLATGFPYYQFDKQAQYMKLFASLMQQCHGLRRIGSAAVDLAYVACGRFDAFFEYNLNSWDVAAGAFLVQEAGGSVMNFTGGDEFLQTREILASNGLINTEVLATMQDHFNS